MRVCGISSWPPRPCGIATYFQEQSSALRRLGHEFQIVCHTDDGQHQDQPGVHGVLDLCQPDWPAQVADHIIHQVRPDLVHVQHEFGLYQQREGEHARGLVELVRRLQAHRLPIVITYHTLVGNMWQEHQAHYRELIPLSTISVAHAHYQVQRLQQNLGYIPDNMRYVEHGAHRHSPEEIARLRRQGRQELGVGERPVVMLNGFFADNKGHEYLVERWDRIYQRLHDQSTVLAALGGVRVSGQQAYYDNLVRLAKRSQYPHSIMLQNRIFTSRGFSASLAAADLLVAPYKEASQSGVLAHAASVGTPVLARDIEGLGAFVRSARQELIPHSADTAADMEVMAERVVEIMNDAGRRQEMQRAVLDYVDRVIAWDRVAERYHAIYLEAIARCQAGAAACWPAPVSARGDTRTHV